MTNTTVEYICPSATITAGHYAILNT